MLPPGLRPPELREDTSARQSEPLLNRNRLFVGQFPYDGFHEQLVTNVLTERAISFKLRFRKKLVGRRVMRKRPAIPS